MMDFLFGMNPLTGLIFAWLAVFGIAILAFIVQLIIAIIFS